MNDTDYDLAVIGTGPAASTVATKVREKGRRVAIDALAMKFGLKSRDLKSTLFTFPSFAVDIRKII